MKIVYAFVCTSWVLGNNQLNLQLPTSKAKTTKMKQRF